MVNDLSFDDLSPRTCVVHIQGKPYTLSEPTEAAHCAYTNAQLRAVKAKTDGTNADLTMGNGMADAETVLVAACLTDDLGAAVSVEAVKKWPARIVKALRLKVKELAGETTKSAVQSAAEAGFSGKARQSDTPDTSA